MTGWRIGWLLVPDDLLDAVDRLAGNFAICPPALSQHAAVAAFDAYAELDANVARYARQPRAAARRLPAIGMDRLAPADGAFYVYADVSRLDRRLAGVRRPAAGRDRRRRRARASTSTRSTAARFIRLSFAGDGDELERGVKLLAEWLAR